MILIGTVTGNAGSVAGGSAGGSGMNSSVAAGGGIVGIGANKGANTITVAGAAGQGSVSNNTAE